MSLDSLCAAGYYSITKKVRWGERAERKGKETEQDNQPRDGEGEKASKQKRTKKGQRKTSTENARVLHIRPKRIINRIAKLIGEGTAHCKENGFRGTGIPLARSFGC